VPSRLYPLKRSASYGETDRAKQTASPKTIETLGSLWMTLPSTVTISEKLAYPLLRLGSVAVGTAVLKDFEVVVWGTPVIPPEILASLDGDKLYPLGSYPSSAIDGIIECRGVLGADFRGRRLGIKGLL
jgi:hypothetical protein